MAGMYTNNRSTGYYYPTAAKPDHDYLFSTFVHHGDRRRII